LLTALSRGDALLPLEGGQPGSGGCDLYSLWAAMTALTQEVRLQGRTFKQLNETLVQSLEASSEGVQDTGAAEELAEPTRIQQDEGRQVGKRQIHLPVGILLDLRDRVERGGSTRTTRPGSWRRRVCRAWRAGWVSAGATRAIRRRFWPRSRTATA